MLAMSMVGRVGELDELVGAWARVADGGPPPAGSPPVTAVITGAAGVGKSMLVTRALAAMSPRPSVVLSGTARVHAPAPYDWLAAVLSCTNAGELPIPADALASFAQQPDGQGERFAPAALLRMAVRTVRSLVRAGPAVLVVEDLHAFDPASLNLVGELAAAPDLPVLLLVTSQLPDAAVSPKLAARTLARLTGTPGSIRQHLGPLDLPEVAALLGQVYPDDVPAQTVAAIWGRTGGNPYCLRELLVTAGGSGPEALARTPLPGHLEPAVPPASPADPEVQPSLTAREREVLACLAEGMSDKQVARSLGISPRTVNVHVSNLLRKTRLASRTEAALWAVRHLTAIT